MVSLTEKIILKIIQDYLRENVSNYSEGVGDALAKELVSKGVTLNGIDMKYFLDDKEVTPEELAQAIDDLDPGQRRLRRERNYRARRNQERRYVFFQRDY